MSKCVSGIVRIISFYKKIDSIYFSACYSYGSASRCDYWAWYASFCKSLRHTQLSHQRGGPKWPCIQALYSFITQLVDIFLKPCIFHTFVDDHIDRINKELTEVHIHVFFYHYSWDLLRQKGRFQKGVYQAIVESGIRNPEFGIQNP